MVKTVGQNDGRRNRGRLLVLLAAWAASAAFGQELPQPKNHVEDRAGVMSRDISGQLDRYLTELEQKTGTQMIVLTLPTTGDKPIRDFALETGRRWKLGEAGKNNGVLVVVAVKDRKYTIETGYGSEGALPDSFCGEVGRQYFQPNFKRGDFSKGIYEGVLALATKVAQDTNVTVTGMPQKMVSGKRSGKKSTGAGFWIIIVFVILVSVMGRRGRRSNRAHGGSGGSGWLLWTLFSMLNSGGGWGGGRGGGGNWGGGGSFGGGRGGSFGGGGASGGW